MAHTPAVTSSELAAAAGKKTTKVRRKLKAAEAELTRSNSVLVKELPARKKKLVMEALKDTQAAEEKVREAAEELEVVTELLSDAETTPQQAKTPVKGSGKSGQGAKSLIPHLRSDAAAKLPAD